MNKSTSETDFFNASDTSPAGKQPEPARRSANTANREALLNNQGVYLQLVFLLPISLPEIGDSL